MNLRLFPASQPKSGNEPLSHACVTDESTASKPRHPQRREDAIIAPLSPKRPDPALTCRASVRGNNPCQALGSRRGERQTVPQIVTFVKKTPSTRGGVLGATVRHRRRESPDVA